MNQPKFLAYGIAMETVAAVANIAKSWRGWAPLADQARRAASSVALNLAEGNGYRFGTPDRQRFQRIALGSALELEAILEIARQNQLGERGKIDAAVALSKRLAAICTALCRR